jgi:hypothetical protein
VTIGPAPNRWTNTPNHSTSTGGSRPSIVGATPTATQGHQVTADEFRSLALSFPEAAELSHMGHPDFRVRGKIFATLGPDEQWGMVKLTPDQQATYLRIAPGVFRPASGAWGRQGATLVTLCDADETSVQGALLAAWRNTAPKRLLQQFEEKE